MLDIETCKGCFGKGLIVENDYVLICDVCKGKGFIEWIEQLFGCRPLTEEEKKILIERMLKYVRRNK